MESGIFIIRSPSPRSPVERLDQHKRAVRQWRPGAGDITETADCNNSLQLRNPYSAWCRSCLRCAERLSSLMTDLIVVIAAHHSQRRNIGQD